MQKIVLAVALAGLFALPLCAQEVPSAEIYGGYQLVHNEGESAHGFTAAFEKNVTSVVGIVGDFGFATDVVESGAEAYSFAGGPRFSYRADKVRPFAHALFGLVRFDADASSNNFGMIFGGGLDISVSESVSIRPVQLEAVSVRLGGNWNTGMRYSAGVVFKLGSLTK